MKRGLIFTWILFVLSILLVFLVRTWVCEHELKTVRSMTGSSFVPFMVESAIMYGYAHDVAQGKPIAACDPGLAGMEKVEVSKQMFLGMEYFLGWGYRIRQMISGGNAEPGPYEDDEAFADWVRLQIRLWISITGGLIFLWLIVMRCNRWLAFSGALLYAFSPAAIARYTGQDLVRGEFAMPFIILSLLVFAWILRKPVGWKYFLLGFSVFCSFAFWDAPQVLFSVLAVFEMGRILIGGRVSQKRRYIWLSIFVAIIASAVLIPYHRYHMLCGSPLLVVILPLLLFILFVVSSYNLVAKWRYGIVVGAVLFALWRYLSSFGNNYGHFFSLVIAKIKFMNVKPANPALLDFDARMLWTPAMHSATWEMTRAFFPYALTAAAVLGVLSVLVFRRRFTARVLPLIYQVLTLTLFFFIMYVFIVRAHVFCVIFLCMLLPLLWNVFRRRFRNRICYSMILICSFLIVAGEGWTSLRLKRQYAAGYFKETAGLIKWLRSSKVKGAVILSDMNLSPLLKAYCGANIVTQPKFELKIPRDIVEEYLRLMYHGNMDEFEAFCRKYHVGLVVFDRAGSYELPLHIYSNRYIADGRKIKRTAPAWLLEKQPGGQKRFFQIKAPKELEYIGKSYYVFRYISAEDLGRAEKLAAMAHSYWLQGRKELAKKLADAAISLAPNSERAYIVYFTIFGKIPGDNLNGLVHKR